MFGSESWSELGFAMRRGPGFLSGLGFDGGRKTGFVKPSPSRKGNELEVKRLVKGK